MESVMGDGLKKFDQMLSFVQDSPKDLERLKNEYSERLLKLALSSASRKSTFETFKKIAKIIPDKIKNYSFTENGYNFFHMVSSSKDVVVDAMIFLVEHLGFDVNSKSKVGGITPLHTAVTGFDSDNKKNMANLQYLLDQGADLKAKDSLGNTPSQLADLLSKSLASHMISKDQRRREILQNNNNRSREQSLSLGV